MTRFIDWFNLLRIFDKSTDQSNNGESFYVSFRTTSSKYFRIRFKLKHSGWWLIDTSNQTLENQVIPICCFNLKTRENPAIQKKNKNLKPSVVACYIDHELNLLFILCHSKMHHALCTFHVFFSVIQTTKKKNIIAAHDNFQYCTPTDTWSYAFFLFRLMKQWLVP